MQVKENDPTGMLHNHIHTTKDLWDDQERCKLHELSARADWGLSQPLPLPVPLPLPLPLPRLPARVNGLPMGP